MDRPYFHPHSLQGKYGRSIPDMAVGNVRLNGQDVHDFDNNRNGGELSPPLVFEINPRPDLLHPGLFVGGVNERVGVCFRQIDIGLSHVG